MSAEGHNTRLHISPLDQTLLDAILHGKPAQEISFHSIPTFPENNYGFITLPNEDAQKIMKKLNGAILRGRKLRIQPARPRYTVNHDDGGASNRSTATTTPSTSNTPTDVSRKRRLTDNVVLGDLLPQKRHIKRAWTEPIMKRKSALPAGVKNPQRSKYTDKRECLFRIKLPPNKLDAMDKEVAKPTPQTKSKRSGPIREVTVHEFAKTYKHPSFIRSDAAVVDSALTHLFDDAVGWLDRLGHVKEPISTHKTLLVPFGVITIRLLSRTMAD